jgi:hypothetical protein
MSKCAYCKSREREEGKSRCSYCREKLIKRYAEDTEFRERQRKYAKDAYDSAPEKHRLQRRISHAVMAGLDRAHVLQYIEERGDVSACDICQKECPTGRALAMDHCHDTMQIRGFLCANCNQGLGKFKDSTELLNRAIGYLTES